MNIDPTGEYLVLYGFNENAVVFQIHPLMTPVIRYDNNVSDAHVADRALWASCPNMVVYNTRLGKSMDNRDFIFTGDNDQTGMTKFRVSMTNDPLPNMGENEKQVGGAGEIQRLILNKQTGDILMCTSTFGGKAQSQVYKMTPTEALLVAEFPGSYGDFAAYGTRIIAKDGGGFFEAKYGDRLLEAKTTPIVTDIRKKPLWKGDKPDFYRISGSHLMDFDEAGNLMTAQGRDFWIIRK